MRNGEEEEGERIEEWRRPLSVTCNGNCFGVKAARRVQSPHGRINSDSDLGSYWKVIAQINNPLFGAEIAQGLNDCSNTQTQIGSFVFFSWTKARKANIPQRLPQR